MFRLLTLDKRKMTRKVIVLLSMLRSLKVWFFFYKINHLDNVSSFGVAANHGKEFGGVSTSLKIMCTCFCKMF